MLYEVTIQQFSKMLGNLNRMLDKAAGYADSKKFESEVLLHSRLAPDQFNFIRQVQIACDTAKGAAARLSGKEAPVYEDHEKSLADLKARIDKTVAYLKTYTAKDLAGAEERRITQPRWAGKHMSGAEFACQHVLPNFYFHVTTAYAILRHNGVDLGKGDYLGEMPFKTP